MERGDEVSKHSRIVRMETCKRLASLYTKMGPLIKRKAILILSPDSLAQSMAAGRDAISPRGQSLNSFV